jgi:hypothetical protein
MSKPKINKRVSSALMQSLNSGVVPRVGLEHIMVGRNAEVGALLKDIDIISDGGATFRMIVGRYGSGKSFLGQLIRNEALAKNFVVMDADLGISTRLTGSKNEGLDLYRKLLASTATKTRTEGGAFSALLERWISDIQQKVVREEGIEMTDRRFGREVENYIRDAVDQMENMEHGFDFSNVINAYWRGHLKDDDILKESAIRWLRGEYSTKSEARRALGDVSKIIEDDSWYDYIRLLAQFVKSIGYKGLLIFIDEAVNLYKLNHKVSRDRNYEKLLTIFNDTTQGRAEYLGVIFGATPQMVEDTRRGLYSYDALKTRLEASSFSRQGLRNLSGPVIQLEPLTPEEILALLFRLREIHALHNRYDIFVTDKELELFISVIQNRIGAETLITPREIIKDFLSVLNIMQDNPGVTFKQLVEDKDFKPSKVESNPELLTADNEILDDEDDNRSSLFTSFKL